MAKSSVKAIPLTFLNSNVLGMNLTELNPDGLDNNCFLIRIINESNISIIISYDGATANDVLPPNTTLQLPLQSNASPSGYICNLSKGQVVWISSVTGGAGVGEIYLAGYYQEAS